MLLLFFSTELFHQSEKLSLMYKKIATPYFSYTRLKNSLFDSKIYTIVNFHIYEIHHAQKCKIRDNFSQCNLWRVGQTLESFEWGSHCQLLSRFYFPTLCTRQCSSVYYSRWNYNCDGINQMILLTNTSVGIDLFLIYAFFIIFDYRGYIMRKVKAAIPLWKITVENYMNEYNGKNTRKCTNLIRRFVQVNLREYRYLYIDPSLISSMILYQIITLIADLRDFFILLKPLKPI